MASSITLQRRVTALTNGEFRLQVWVSETTDNIPADIFLFREFPEVDGWEPNYDFYSVCMYADIINYPVDATDSSSSYFRKRGLDLDFASLSALDDFWDTLNTQTTALINDIVRTHSATPEDASYSGSNINVTASLKHYDSDDYSSLLTMSADSAIFVVEKQSDGEPELIAVASLADLNSYSTTPVSTGPYRVSDCVLAFRTVSLYTSAKTALDADFAALDAELTNPGLSIINTTTSQAFTNSEVAVPQTYYFGE